MAQVAIRKCTTVDYSAGGQCSLRGDINMVETWCVHACIGPQLMLSSRLTVEIAIYATSE